MDDPVSLGPKWKVIFQQFIAGGVSTFWTSRDLPLASDGMLWEYKTRWAARNASARTQAGTMAVEESGHEEGKTVKDTAGVPILHSTTQFTAERSAKRSSSDKLIEAEPFRKYR